VGELTIVRGFAPALAAAAARLYDAAFGEKFAVAIPDAARRLGFLEAALTPDFCLVALGEACDEARAGTSTTAGPLLGLVGFQTAAGSFTGGLTGEGLEFPDLKRHLGFLGALRALLVFGLFERKRRPGEMVLDGITVAEQARGRGVGGALLDAACDLAAEQGYDRVRLDVVDTNPAARRLYERKGFTVEKVERFGWLRPVLGFGGSATMVRRVGAGARAEEIP
jgi:ribosomal protein S18 acetylase RimI-like enzyme